MQQDHSFEAQLLERYIRGNATPEEAAELFAWLRKNAPETISSLEQVMAQSYDEALMRPGVLSESASERILADMLNRINRQTTPVIPLHARTARRQRWYSAAAAVALVLLLTGYWYFQNPRHHTQQAVVNTTQKDIPAPATNRAMITLADGSQVFLDSTGNGQLARQGNVQLVKLADGQVAYRAADRSLSGSETAYNTLTNPRGSKVIDMTLSDGSHIWLNAGSSVTYPVTFIGNERKVSMTGEAYFEVAHNVTASGAKQPFIVEKGNMQVTVLGTHFNVNAYDDEGDITVTLLEGSVKVSGNNDSATMKPGQQAAIHNSSLIIHNSPDLEQVMAWKSGLFKFDHTSLSAIMNQVSRWYDVEVVFKGKPSGREFGGGISRSLPLSDILKLLEANGVTFKWEGKTLEVTP